MHKAPGGPRRDYARQVSGRAERKTGIVTIVRSSFRKAFFPGFMVTGLLCADACTNDYSEFDFNGSGDSSPDGPAAGGIGGAGGRPASSGGQGGTSGSASGGSSTSIDGGEMSDATSDVSRDGSPVDATSDADVIAELPDPPSCSALYGMAPGFVLCNETPTTCVIAVNTGGNNCDNLCSNFGGRCLAADDNDIPLCVAIASSDNCTTNRTTEICTCTR